MEQRNDKNLIIGTIFILVGAVLVLGKLDIIPWQIERILFSWQMLLVGIGAVIFAVNENKTSGIVLMAIGGFFLLPKIFQLPFSFHGLFWPMLFIGVGALMIFRKRDDQRFFSNTSGTSSMDYLDEVNVFGGGEKIINSNAFRGGKITAVFGGSEINLLNSKLADGVHKLEVVYVFGGGTILVPSDWNVKVDVVSIFGGFSDKRVHSTNYVVEPKKELIIKGVAIFGGGEIKTLK